MRLNRIENTKRNMVFGIIFRSVYKELHADRETGC